MAKARKTRSKKTTAKASGTTTKKSTNTRAKKLDKANVKAVVKQVVKSKREIKYKYPEGIEGTLERKAWRQKVRNKNTQFIKKIAKADSETSKKKLGIQMRKFRKEHYMVP